MRDLLLNLSKTSSFWTSRLAEYALLKKYQTLEMAYNEIRQIKYIVTSLNEKLELAERENEKLNNKLIFAD